MTRRQFIAGGTAGLAMACAGRPVRSALGKDSLGGDASGGDAEYVMDGLEVWIDARMNGDDGIVNQIDGSRLCSATFADQTDRYFVLEGNSGNATTIAQLISANRQSGLTIEVCSTVDEAIYNFDFYGTKYSNEGYYVVNRWPIGWGQDGVAALWRINWADGGPSPTVAPWNPAIEYGGVPHTIVLTSNNGESEFSIDGKARSAKRGCGIPQGAAFVFCGNGIKKHSFRLYSRALSDEELAYNFAVDMKRFGV